MSKKKDEKIKINLSDFSDFEKVTFLGTTFNVKKVINFSEQESLCKNYLNRLFSKEYNPLSGYVDTNRFLADNGLRGDVISMLTNLDTDYLADKKEEIIFDDSLFREITSKISNWNTFILLLGDITEDVLRERDLKGSLGVILDSIVKRLSDSFDALGEDGFKSLSDSIREVGKSIKDSRISGLMDEAKGK